MDPYKILLYPMMGEKATMLREKGNILTFIVDKKSNKKEIKEAVELLYTIKVLSINTVISPNGKKKAHIKLDPKYSAEEIVSQFGIM